ncbi:MAG: hypothetical protein KAS65_10750 [Candidatus Aminicenantes bacterium]|nr:hypothetical protein [Candidatus Aminicenantes bacterium]
MKLNGLKIFALIVLVVVGFSRCNIFESGSTSNTILIINSITDKDGELPIFSNVNYLINTLGEVTLTAEPINPFQDITTYYYSVIVDQIDVEYSRSDGLSQEGRDIPFSFSQKVNYRVDLEEITTFPFNIVQHVAKLEPPLVDLINYGEEEFLKLEAKVTFHGTDLGGHRVNPVIAVVSIWCGNFGEEEL